MFICQEASVIIIIAKMFLTLKYFQHYLFVSCKLFKNTTKNNVKNMFHMCGQCLSKANVWHKLNGTSSQFSHESVLFFVLARWRRCCWIQNHLISNEAVSYVVLVQWLALSHHSPRSNVDWGFLLMFVRVPSVYCVPPQYPKTFIWG